MRRIEKNYPKRDDTFIKLTVVQLSAGVLIFLLIFLLAKRDASFSYRLRTEFEQLMSDDWDVADSIKENFGSVFAWRSPAEQKEPANGVYAASVSDIRAVDVDYSCSELGKSFYSDEQPVMPVNGPITSDYGYRTHPINGGEHFHSGRDIAADEGTDIYAALDGTVLAVGVGVSSGNYIKIDHGDGLVTLYCHCSAVYAEEGEKIRKGDIIAAVGQTGAATGPHLHFEVHKNSELVDPSTILDGAADVY